MSYASFVHILQRNPISMLRFSTLMSKRVQQTLEKHAQVDERGRPSTRSFPNLSTIALLPCGTAHPDPDFLARVARQLYGALASHGPALHLNSRRIDEELGAGTARDLAQMLVRSRVSQWLTQQEENNRFILFEADPGTDLASITPWTK